ncbi:hypothetical protein Taro_049197 [Colocasia esculenta]|uniref:Uncharacterized protein n=1 Tax=Colocasia esculenta TaxID=4460 RepID=A0A843XAA6_COLES|nr:hypothetical protein [Colocasia esculenta]
MALELFSESWATWPAAPSPAAGATSSPRISFSRDLDGATSHHHHIHHQQRTDSSLLDSSSSPDFDFCVSGDRPEQEYSYAADELFSDGFLLPVPILPRGAAAVPSAFPSLSTRTAVAAPSVSSSSVSGIRPVRPLPTPRAEVRKDCSEGISTVPGSGGATEEKPASGKQPTSFWKFGRSSSLNCSGSSSGAVGGTGSRRASLICSLPLLSRSKSTGSHPSPPTLKQRQQSFNGTTAIPTPSTATAAASSSGSGSKLSRKGSGNGGTAVRNPYYYGQHQHGGGGVRISPVLNVPPPYIPKGSGAGLFSFGHLLCSSRERSRKKTQQPAAPPQQSS